MFSSANQASTKDLYVTNPGQLLGNRYDCNNDSAFSSSSNSQYLYSQRSGSQEYSQQFVPQGSESPGSNFYQKYKAMSPLFSNENNPYRSSAQAPGKINYQQQLQINKAKARERDERDLLDSIVTTVRECTQEVTGTVASMKKDIHQGIRTNDEKVTDMLEKIKTDMNKNYEKLLKVLEEREQDKEKLKDMEKSLTAKDAMISQLQNDLEKLRLQKEEKIVASLKQTYAEQQELNRQQIHQLHQAQVQHIEEQTKRRRDQTEGQEKQHQQLRSESRKQIKELEHRVTQELDTQQKQLEHHMREITESYCQLLEHKHEQQKQDLEKWLVQQMQGKTQKGFVLQEDSFIFFSKNTQTHSKTTYIGKDLNLEHGQIARQFLRVGGQELQDKLNTVCASFGEVVVTRKCGTLPDNCKVVYHVVLPTYARGKGETILSRVISECLQMASDVGLTSIAFPSIGCGNLKYSPMLVAQTFLEECEKFAKGRTSLKYVNLVVYDGSTFQDFQDELASKSGGRSPRGRHSRQHSQDLQIKNG
ncbi:golgin subfamily A member 6C-like [Lingula anatina]|uniref:Golgin subfamily A member 6C-like n=1 Tax=Lingula anatina TaxID=7574 RepID=A0A2R2MK03_LINAN|nr:golgin subfamily A member 6C-like [Lingula anatina]|eukprot:XP_023930549.1 golgin subfamily A member 6C-like [Lingula anatina]